MSTAFKQDDRPIGIETPLGKDKLVLTGFTGEERLSGLFSFSLKLQSKDGGIKATDIVGKTVSFWVRHQDGVERWFNGIVNGFTASGKDDRAHHYSAHVVPWLWLLTRGSDCCVHECAGAKSAKEVVDGLLQNLGFSDFKWEVSGSPQMREYCVQYKETHFDFFSRLLEEEGWSYYFVHEKGKHTLQITDDPGTKAKDAKDKEAKLASNLSQPELYDNLSAWSHEYEYVSGKYAAGDYNFETPSSDMFATKNGLHALQANSGLEFFDYPGEYAQKGAGESLLKLRMEEEESAWEAASGESECRSFSPGLKFEMKEHHIDEEKGKKWVITAVEHFANLGGSYYSSQSHSDEIYRNRFRCAPDTVKLRPARIRRKPRVMGLLNAIVTGPAGEEIHTDKYGRIRVQFFWDREGKKDDKCCCWVRVATPWAGNNWGMVHIPRIGQEVIVSFLDGDPDHPIVVGSLYNAEQMPPYSLDANKTQSGIKSRSSMSGTDENFNEIRFEDKKDKEEVYIHAEKDLNCVIENNETRKVGFDKKDKGDQTVEIFNNQVLKVGTSQASDGSQTVEIWKDRTTTLKTGNDALTIDQGNQTTTLKMGNQETTLDMGNQTTTLKMGNQTTKLNLGAMTDEAMQSIELKVGSNSIKIDQTGVTISGIMVKIEGKAMLQASAPMSQIGGDAMLTLKGGLTMIN